MKIERAIEVLVKHQAWRRDQNVPSTTEMQNPFELGEAIDYAIEELKKLKTKKEMKQTAVEYLLDFCNSANCRIPNDIIQEAKEMEKEQTINFAYDYVNSGSIGCLFDGDSAPELDIDTDPRQYYHRTFNTNEK